ncbi:MAG: ankyrin repeat domain-containing protein [Rickettsia endosymbiont of Ixodes persulcatus]|nr:ankyrin repeat domain-containing protein [Rickettsia endosymbiont of Ixodes persulcatus]MCZ6903130.1 ankyrin repeat domain-containing protein [Rickettsia endosymbiont of Ixodes persulcatus]MCZ6909103.1 ankyrin repeat domain-containing protein [Rickettsia endosymbiont of Ixodes persulcatus]MCZ6926076.1 ankyrin repeat domain-containing protein [Rickettsia endosymbiont of Ixodes persulcatus]
MDAHKNEHGDTALYNTLFLGDLKRAKLLLEHNASPNIKNNYGQTILHSLITSNSMEEIELLLQNARSFALSKKYVNLTKKSFS